MCKVEYCDICEVHKCPDTTPCSVCGGGDYNDGDGFIGFKLGHIGTNGTTVCPKCG